MSQLQDETAAQARPETQTEEQAETQFDEGFGLGGEDEGRDTGPAKQQEQPAGENLRPFLRPQVDTAETPPATPQVRKR